MAKFIVTTSEAILTQASHLQSLFARLCLLVPPAAIMQELVITAVNGIEVAFVELGEAQKAYLAAVDAEKKTAKGLREAVFGLISYVELTLPALVGRLPILSKFDVTNPYVVADELFRLSKTVPELQQVGEGIKKAKDNHVQLVAAVDLADKRRLQARDRYRGAQLELGRVIGEARKYIFDNAPEGTNFAEQLKKKASRKPGPKKPRKAKQPAVVIVAPHQPVTNDQRTDDSSSPITG